MSIEYNPGGCDCPKAEADLAARDKVGGSSISPFWKTQLRIHHATINNPGDAPESI